MAAYNLSPVFNAFSNFGSNTAASAPNLPLANGKLYTYAAGTSTPVPVYTTSVGGGPWSNPIILSSDGRVPGQIWLAAGSSYKFVLYDSGGNAIPNGTEDNITGVGDTTSNVVSEWIATGLTPTYSSATTFTTTGNTTSTFQVGRRIQATVTAGTVYGTITSATFGVATTVVCVMDAGQALDSGMSAVNVGFLGTTGTHVSVPMTWTNDLSLRNLTATGTLNVTGASTLTGAVSAPAGVTGNLTGNVTGAVTGNATGLSGASPALGTSWNIDANGQLTNNGATTYLAAYYNSGAITSGTTITYTTAIAQQGANFSLSGGSVATAAAGLYEVEAYGNFSDPGVANVNITCWFAVSAGTVYGPSAVGSGTVVGMEGASGMVFSTWSIKCYWQATAGATITPTTNTTFGAGTYTVVAGAQIKIRRIG